MPAARDSETGGMIFKVNLNETLLLNLKFYKVIIIIKFKNEG